MRQASIVFRQTSEGVLVAPPSCGLLTVPDLISQVRAWCRAGSTDALVVDLSEVEYIDGSVYRALVWAHQHCATLGHPMTIVAPREGVLTDEEDLLLQMLAVWPGADAPAAARTTPSLVSA